MRCQCGSTALIEAVTAVSNCKEIIATLLDAGASPKAVRKVRGAWAGLRGPELPQTGTDVVPPTVGPHRL